ncbi:MAG: methionyl-tRNA formyltransferase [Patescibacteria group bacterium]|nr:methionyl-tRNA formyltransferase [Patescibacteria group bacterium]
MVKKLKIAYFGSPDFSAAFLEKILTDEKLKEIISVEFVVTQPDKPAGRKQVVTPTPAKQIALKNNLKVFEIEKFDLKNLLKIKNLKLEILKLDLAFVYAYSSIIPKEFLELPHFGFWCLHPSLLPKYRGASPIAFALLNGEKKTGVTIFKIDEKIDHGPIIAQKSLTIKNTDYRNDLEAKLTNLGFELFKIIIKKLANSSSLLTFKPQSHKVATYTRTLKKDDGYIKYETLKKVLNNQLINPEDLPDLIKENLIHQPTKKIKNSAKKIYDFFRALSPWPGVWTILPNKKRLKILKLKTFDTLNSILYIESVQLEGKKPVDFETFKKSYSFF